MRSRKLRHFIPTLAGVLSCCLLVANACGQILYSDNFDVNSSASYTVNQDPDASVVFAYDYSLAGIPSAPNSTGGTRRGVRFEANNGDATAAAQAINISPTGQSFTGDYVLRFDSWLNANGPFPDGGTGSTEFWTAGVGTQGDDIQKSAGTASGAWFAVDNEGQSGIDYRAYLNIALEGPTSTVYAASDFTAPDTTVINRRSANNPYYHTAFPGGQTAPALQQMNFPQQTGALKAGAVGFAWRQVEIKKLGNNVSLSIDKLPIATFINPTLTGNNVFVGHWDVFASISDNPALSFGVIDNLVVARIPEPATAVLVLGIALTFGARRSRRIGSRGRRMR
jgi:hypothetical protein